MSIYEEIGGAEAVGAAVELFYVKVLADKQLAPYFETIDVARLKGHQRMFIRAALGGPEAYTGRGMGEAHAHLGITPQAFMLVVRHLASTLKELGVPASTILEIGARLLPLKDEIVIRSLVA